MIRMKSLLTLVGVTAGLLLAAPQAFALGSCYSGYEPTVSYSTPGTNPFLPRTESTACGAEFQCSDGSQNNHSSNLSQDVNTVAALNAHILPFNTGSRGSKGNTSGK